MAVSLTGVEQLAQEHHSEMLAAITEAKAGYASELTEYRATIAGLATQVSDLAGRLYAAGRPGPLNTGVLTGVPRTTVPLGYTTAMDGQLIENQTFNGQVTVKHSGVIFRNCYFASTAPILVKCLTPVAVPARFYDCTWKPVTRAISIQNAVQGQDWEIYRGDISGSIDGVGMQGRNCKLVNSWVHALAWWANDPTQGGGQSHNDAVQVFGGTGFEITGNSLEMGANQNAAVMVTNDLGAVDGITITGNTMVSSGSVGSAVNFGNGTFKRVTITGQRVGPKATWKAGPLLVRKAIIDDPATRISDNQYLDGTPVPTSS